MYVTFDYNKTPVKHKYTEEFVLDRDTINEYKKAVGYDSQDNFVPNSIFAIYKFWNTTLGNPPAGTIHLKQMMEYYRAPKVDDIFQVEITIKDKYRKKERDYLIFETVFYKGNKVYCRQITTYLWGFAER